MLKFTDIEFLVSIFFIIYSLNCFCNILTFQYEARNRIGAAEALKHPFFKSLGPSVHKIPDSKSLFFLFCE